jgi:predicted RecB family nuclease
MAVTSLSKSRFLAGMQCHRQLWWKVHEPDAPELVVDVKQQAVFDQGHQVGEVARTFIPGGELIDLPFDRKRDRIAATKRALERGADVLYEGSFEGEGVYAAVDILQKKGNRFDLIEVKSSTKVKEEYIPDAAVQVFAARRAGIPVERVEIMHLNRDCAYPDMDNLFTREDVTRPVEDAIPRLPDEITAQLAMLQGPLPEVTPSEHCLKPHPCPFMSRCWAPRPEFHVSTLYYGYSRQRQLELAGVTSLLEMPADFPLTPIQARQIRSVKSGRPVIESSLRGALGHIESPTAYLDFETISPAVPVWNGCHPYERVPVQFSCDVVQESGATTHFEWLTEGPADPRPEMARRVIEACAKAATVIAYNSPFERDCLRTLAAGAPEYKDELEAIERKLFDALPLVREHVYHPGFAGSFSLKSVYPALMGRNAYGALDIADGELASIQLSRLIFESQKMSAEERATLRRSLRRYCALDTEALAQLIDRLREMAGIGIKYGQLELLNFAPAT